MMAASLTAFLSMLVFGYIAGVAEFLREQRRYWEREGRTKLARRLGNQIVQEHEDRRRLEHARDRLLEDPPELAEARALARDAIAEHHSHRQSPDEVQKEIDELRARQAADEFFDEAPSSSSDEPKPK